MEALNKFEEELMYVPFTPDWYEERCMKAKLFESYIYEMDVPNSETFIHVLLVVFFDTIYLWVDQAGKDGKLHSSQLERVTNKFSSKIIYASDENALTFGPLFFQCLDNNLLKRIR